MAKKTKTAKKPNKLLPAAVRLELFNSSGGLLDHIDADNNLEALERALAEWGENLQTGDEIRVAWTPEE